MQLRNTFFLFFLVISFCTFAGPGTYYQSIDSTKSCANFKTQLYNKISKNITLIPYSLVDNNFNRTDLKPAETGDGFVVVERYSSEIPGALDSCNYRYPSSFCGGLPGTPTVQCQCYDKEHIFPSSWFGGNNDPGNVVKNAYSDMHYIWPGDRMTNFKKGNLPLGHVFNPNYTSYNGCRVGTSDFTLNNGYKGPLVFEPADAFKGDFARAYLYFVTRYEDSLPSMLNRSSADSVLSGNKYPGLDPWILQVCIKWHKQDPPDDFERKRNDSVFAVQGNRNPYIDYPHWAEKVWGVNGISSSCVNTAIRQNKTISFSVYPNPILQGGTLYIQSEKPLLGNITIEVVDMLGAVLMTVSENTWNGKIPIDVSNISKGTYLLRIRNEEDIAVHAFIVQ